MASLLLLLLLLLLLGWLPMMLKMMPFVLH
jgi:hypothetical protein